MGRGDAIRNLKVAEDPNDPLVAINLNNIEMKNILTKLAAWTGKVIIPTDEAMKVKITILYVNTRTENTLKDCIIINTLIPLASRKLYQIKNAIIVISRI